MTVRRATEADLEGVAAVRFSNGPAHADSGANPGYCRHLIEHEHLWVAVEPDGRVIGFGGAVDTDGGRLLSDMFVHADAHGRGVGSSLLAAVLDGSVERYTFATTDPAALPLYMRAGMRTRWTLLELSGQAGALQMSAVGGLEIERVGGDVAAECERALSGADRSALHRYLARRPEAMAMVVTRNGRRVGVVESGLEDDGAVLRLDHVACAPAEADDVLAAVALSSGAERVHAYVPGSSELSARLLRQRFVVDGISLHMATTGAAVHPMVAVVHPGLG